MTLAVAEALNPNKPKPNHESDPFKHSVVRLYMQLYAKDSICGVNMGEYPSGLCLGSVKATWWVWVWLYYWKNGWGGGGGQACGGLAAAGGGWVGGVIPVTNLFCHRITSSRDRLWQRKSFCVCGREGGPVRARVE